MKGKGQDPNISIKSKAYKVLNQSMQALQGHWPSVKDKGDDEKKKAMMLMLGSKGQQ